MKCDIHGGTMTIWKCPDCGNQVMMLDDDDERLACYNADCNFHLELY